MTSVLIWGFYHQGNLGDDLMGMMLYEMLEEIGTLPVIFTSNKRFAAMGYRTVDDFSQISPDILILGGGAFFKNHAASKKMIEEKLKTLGAFIRERAIPVHGISLGSDGVSNLEALSPARQAIVKGDHFKSVALRLASDRVLGLRNMHHLADIVLLAAFCSDRYKRLTPIQPEVDAPRTLINMSRRSATHLPRILWRERGNRVAFFRAHTGEGLTRGEITIPGYDVVEDDRLCAQLGYLKAADRIISAKLHPGVIALSYGTQFESVYARPKTTAFLRETREKIPDPDLLFGEYMKHLRALA
ncbi:hypothetical protein [Qipengyuania sp. 902]|uniref:hypothetical protein n=1 Tax=Qipengyuania sp. 902 TaxID=3417565 RepID=UPI003EBBB8F3